MPIIINKLGAHKNENAVEHVITYCVLHRLRYIIMAEVFLHMLRNLLLVDSK